MKETSGVYWAAFRNDKQLASSPNVFPDAYEDGSESRTLHLPVLYKTKKQAVAEGWSDVRKVKVVLCDED